MKLITYKDIVNLGISAETCFNWTSEMIKNKRTATLPPKISLHPYDGVFCNYMPCIIDVGEKKFTGVKVVSRYPDREPSLDSQLLLIDADNGDFLSLMDANWITAMRTGAVAAHSIKLLAKSNFTEISVMGLGNTARATMLMIASSMPERKFNVRLLKYKGQEISFAERFKDFKNFTFSYVDTVDTLIKGAEVVISCITYTSDDFCDDSCFDKGVLVVPVHTRGFTNCDLFFDKVFADDTGHVNGFKNFSKFRSFAEVCDVVNGIVPGRENDDERILAYNIGLSVHDMYFAAHIYDLLKDNENLPEINLDAPTEKFWI